MRQAGEIAGRMQKLRVLGGVITLAVLMIAAAKTALAPRKPGTPLVGSARAEVRDVFADDEAARRTVAQREWPGDRWSQGDAFHGKESEMVRGQTTKHGVALESVLDVLDADLHARRVPGRHAGVPPCKPRPQYD